MNCCQNSPSSETLVASVRDAPTSVKLVFKTLQYEGDLTPSQLAEETRLSPRTVRKAARELERRGAVTSRTHLTDARKRVYSIDPSLRDADASDDR